MDGSGREWTGNGRELTGVDGSGRKWTEMDGNGRVWTGVGGNGREWPGMGIAEGGRKDMAEK